MRNYHDMAMAMDMAMDMAMAMCVLCFTYIAILKLLKLRSKIQSIAFYAVIIQKVDKVLVFGKFTGDQRNVEVRHCDSRRVLL